jgi:hypothetical protein
VTVEENESRLLQPMTSVVARVFFGGFWLAPDGLVRVPVSAE